MPGFQRQDEELVYDIAGNGGLSILFIHGYSCTAHDWRFQMDSLSARYTCIALDQRGHGRSVDFDGALIIENFAKDAFALLDDLKIEQAVLCGHSMGTRIAFEAALLAPDRVSGLVLVDGSKVEASPEAVQASIFAAFEASSFEAWSDANMSGMFLDRLASDDRDEILRRARELGAENGFNPTTQ